MTKINNKKRKPLKCQCITLAVKLLMFRHDWLTWLLAVPKLLNYSQKRFLVLGWSCSTRWRLFTHTILINNYFILLPRLLHLVTTKGHFSFSGLVKNGSYLYKNLDIVEYTSTKMHRTLWQNAKLPKIIILIIMIMFYSYHYHVCIYKPSLQSVHKGSQYNFFIY